MSSIGAGRWDNRDTAEQEVPTIALDYGSARSRHEDSIGDIVTTFAGLVLVVLGLLLTFSSLPGIAVLGGLALVILSATLSVVSLLGFRETRRAQHPHLRLEREALVIVAEAIFTAPEPIPRALIQCVSVGSHVDSWYRRTSKAVPVPSIEPRLREPNILLSFSEPITLKHVGNRKPRGAPFGFRVADFPRPGNALAVLVARTSDVEAARFAFARWAPPCELQDPGPP